jgi:hypothetical protein
MPFIGGGLIYFISKTNPFSGFAIVYITLDE